MFFKRIPGTFWDWEVLTHKDGKKICDLYAAGRHIKFKFNGPVEVQILEHIIRIAKTLTKIKQDQTEYSESCEILC